MTKKLIVAALLFGALPATASKLVFSLSTESPEVLIRSYVTDPDGIKAGYLEDGTRTSTNLGMGFGGERVDDDEDGSPGTEVMFNYVRPVKVGVYTMTLFATANTPYEVDVKYALGPQDKSKRIASKGILSAGQTRTYVVEVADLAHPPVVEKTVSLSTLRQDLQTAKAMSQVGGTKFVQQLDKILEQAEKTPAVVEKLRQFVDKLEKAAAGKPDESAGNVKRVVTAEALAALGGDAKTLIAKLEKPGGKK